MQSALAKPVKEFTKERREQGLKSLREKMGQNPILKRLHESISSNKGLVITSYDRMHHRHSRT